MQIRGTASEHKDDDIINLKYKIMAGIYIHIPFAKVDAFTATFTVLHLSNGKMIM